MAGDTDMPGTCFLWGVSIHARAWRATGARGGKGGSGSVSIHARAWRATLSPRLKASSRMFQSTPAHGGRLGAARSCRWYDTFQSTPAHGGRLGLLADKPRVRGFNPRARMAGDLGGMSHETPVIGFNPRPRMAGDRPCRIALSSGSWFQSTPAHGGRPVTLTSAVASKSFNPRPRMAGDDPRVHIRSNS